MTPEFGTESLNNPRKNQSGSHHSSKEPLQFRSVNKVIAFTLKINKVHQNITNLQHQIRKQNH